MKARYLGFIVSFVAASGALSAFARENHADSNYAREWVKGDRSMYYGKSFAWSAKRDGLCRRFSQCWDMLTSGRLEAYIREAAQRGQPQEEDAQECDEVCSQGGNDAENRRILAGIARMQREYTDRGDDDGAASIGRALAICQMVVQTLNGAPAGVNNSLLFQLQRNFEAAEARNPEDRMSRQDLGNAWTLAYGFAQQKAGSTTATQAKPAAKPGKPAARAAAKSSAPVAFHPVAWADTPTLNKFGKDLTAQGADLQPAIGRDGEVRQTMQILARVTKSNPVLLGDPGVGKTAIFREVARRIALGQVPPQLRNKRVLQLEMASIVGGTKYRGELEERVEKIVSEAKAHHGELILAIDELHTIVGAGEAEGQVLDVSNMLKQALADGEISAMGATTVNEYALIAKDGALERRFQAVYVDEPSVATTVEILKSLAARYGEHHGVTYDPKALEAAAQLSNDRIKGRFLPDKAIDLMDEAGSEVSFEGRPTVEVKDIEAILAQKEKGRRGGGVGFRATE